RNGVGTGEPPERGGSDRVRTALAGADANHVLQRVHEDLAVADAAGVGRLDDGLHDLVHEIVAARDLDLDLGQEVDDVLGAAIELGVALLPAEALDLRHGHALDPDGLQRFLDLVELEGLDDRLDLAHGAPLRAGTPPGCGRGRVGRHPDRAGPRYHSLAGR